jgi:hypothetical protein
MKDKTKVKKWYKDRFERGEIDESLFQSSTKAIDRATKQELKYFASAYDFEHRKKRKK